MNLLKSSMNISRQKGKKFQAVYNNAYYNLITETERATMIGMPLQTIAKIKFHNKDIFISHFP